MLVQHNPDFLGIQESLPNQVEFIDHKLKGHALIGFGRDGKGSASESVPVFYDNVKYQLLDWEVFWLSETPDIPSKGWDAALNRITTYAVLKNRKAGDTTHVFNTHFDHRGELSRKEAAALLVKKIKALGLERSRVILMGDLNSTPEEEPVQILRNVLQDAYAASEQRPRGPVGTFNAFDPDGVPDERIDYVFSLNARVLNYVNLDTRRRNGRWISDHLPVLVELAE